MNLLAPEQTCPISEIDLLEFIRATGFRLDNFSSFRGTRVLKNYIVVEYSASSPKESRIPFRIGA